MEAAATARAQSSRRGMILRNLAKPLNFYIDDFLEYILAQFLPIPLLPKQNLV
jgi:hypothetical protein